MMEGMLAMMILEHMIHIELHKLELGLWCLEQQLNNGESKWLGLLMGLLMESMERELMMGL